VKNKKFDSQGVLGLKDGKELREAEYDFIGNTNKVYNALKLNKIKISDYYALVMFDGDNMGKWLSGEFLKQEDKSRLKEFHKLLSRKLAHFGSGATETIKRMSGEAVYAGGDDFMGFAPLEYMPELIETLRENFNNQVNKEIHKVFSIDNDLTFSAGVVVNHYKYPLSEAVKWARKVEDEAKEDGHRNAFAIAVIKHSGEIHKTVCKWSYESNGESYKTIDLLKELVNELTNDNSGFSNRFIKNVELEFEGFSAISKKMMETELKRLLIRSSKLTGVKKYEKAKSMSNKLTKLFIDLQSDKLEQNFFHFLNIADFMAREAK